MSHQPLDARKQGVDSRIKGFINRRPTGEYVCTVPSSQAAAKKLLLPVTSKTERGRKSSQSTLPARDKVRRVGSREFLASRIQSVLAGPAEEEEEVAPALGSADEGWPWLSRTLTTKVRTLGTARRTWETLREGLMMAGRRNSGVSREDLRSGAEVTEIRLLLTAAGTSSPSGSSSAFRLLLITKAAIPPLGRPSKGRERSRVVLGSRFPVLLLEAAA